MKTKMSLSRKSSPQIVILTLRVAERICLPFQDLSVRNETLHEGPDQTSICLPSSGPTPISASFPPHATSKISIIDIICLLFSHLHGIIRNHYLLRRIIAPGCATSTL